MREKLGHIEALRGGLEKELIAYGAGGKTARSALLAVEELLLLYRNRLKSDDAEVDARVIRGTRIFSVRLRIPGEAFSPDALQSESGVPIFGAVVRNCGFSVNYAYADSVNQIELVIEKYHGIIRNFLFSVKFIKEKAVIFAAFLAHIVSIVANLFVPILTGQLITAYTENVITQVVVTAASLLVMKAVNSAAFNIAGTLYVRTSFYSASELRKELVSRMLLIKNDSFEKNGAGTFIERTTTDIQTISAGITSILDIFSEGIYYVGVLFASALINFWVFVAEAVTFAVLLIMERRRALRLEIDRKRAFVYTDRLSGDVIDYVNGISEVKLLGAGKAFTEKIAAVSSRAAEYSLATSRHSRWRVIASSCTVAVLSFLVMVFLGSELQRGAVTVAEALILFNYFTIIDRPSVILVQRAIDFFKQFDLAAERVRNLYEGSEFARETYGDLDAGQLHGDIDFDRVTFAYDHDDPGVPDHDVLEDVSFHIRRGETVAFVGKSGSGKSTLLKLLSRQVGCYSGRITVDGHDLSELSGDCLYGSMGVISQTPVLFNCSIRENLLAAKPDATEAELRDACEKACILEDIEAAENGFDTELGEKGVRFSGGQRQRLAIARALLRDTGILLLDEATSAMDNVTQDRIIRTVHNIAGERTVIIVAHRFSTVRDADRIMLVGNKGIMASGTHEELMKSSAEYRELYSLETQ